MIKFIYEQDVNIDVENPGILEVPEGKNVEDLPIKHFVDLTNKKGLSTITKALNNLQVWNKNKNPKLSKWAGDMIDKVSKRVENKKNESLSLRESSIPKWQDDLMREVSDELRKNHLGGDVYDDYDFRGSDALLVMCIEIRRGDWKHDHLATDWIVSEVIDKYDNLKLVKTTTQTTDEDGSDTYSAIHRYLITKEDDIVDDTDDDIEYQQLDIKFLNRESMNHKSRKSKKESLVTEDYKDDLKKFVDANYSEIEKMAKRYGFRLVKEPYYRATHTPKWDDVICLDFDGMLGVKNDIDKFDDALNRYFKKFDFRYFIETLPRVNRICIYY